MSITEKQRLALVEKMAARGRKSRIDAQKVVKRYLDGERVSEIAGDLGVHKETVYNHLRRARDGK